MSASDLVLSWPFRMIASVFTPAHRLLQPQLMRAAFRGAADIPAPMWHEALTLGIWRRPEPEVNVFERVRTPGRPDA